MFETDMAKLMQRYVGRQVTVQTHGYTRVVGTMAGVHESCIQLLSAVRLHELEDSRWYGEIERTNQDESIGAGNQETLISIQAICSITCEEDAFFLDDIADDDRQEEYDWNETDESDAAPLIEAGPDPSDPCELRIGPGLIPLLSGDQSESRLRQLRSVRNRMAEQLAFALPKVRIRDDISLARDSYEIRIHGRTTGSGSIRPGHWLAVHVKDPAASIELDGEETREPAFGIPAVWIDASQREAAELDGCTVVDAWTVLLTHLGETFRRHAKELLTYEETHEILDRVRQRSPSLINSHFSSSDAILRIHRVFGHFLKAGLGISNSEAIAVSVAYHQGREQREEALISQVRLDLMESIVEKLKDRSGEIHCLRLDLPLQRELLHDAAGASGVDAMRVVQAIRAFAERADRRNGRLVVLADDDCMFQVEQRLANLASRQEGPGWVVVSTGEYSLFPSEAGNLHALGVDAFRRPRVSKGRETPRQPR